MTFPEALDAMKAGKKVRRKYGWLDGAYIHIRKDTTVVSWDDGKPYVVFTESIAADDWEVVDDKPALLPCPSCGGEAGFDKSLHKEAACSCRSCGFGTKWFSSILDAANSWNRRVETGKGNNVPTKKRTNFEKWMATITPEKMANIFDVGFECDNYCPAFCECNLDDSRTCTETFLAWANGEEVAK